MKQLPQQIIAPQRSFEEVILIVLKYDESTWKKIGYSYLVSVAKGRVITTDKLVFTGIIFDR